MSIFDDQFGLSGLDGSDGVRLDGEAATDRLGESLRWAGDVNGDGFDDIIVGARGQDSAGDNAGAAYLIFGRASFAAGRIEAAALDGVTGVQLNGATAGGGAGREVAGIGDINGDGFDDLAIGATQVQGKGVTYVVYGSDTPFPADFELADLNGANGFTIFGEFADDAFGRSVSAAGDVNGDGIDDFIAGAPGHDSATGAAYVVFGSTSGFPTTLELADLNGTNGFKLIGEPVRSGRGVGGGGDFNGDGIDDVLVGAEGDATQPGQAYVVFGKAGGFAAEIDLGTLDGSDGFRMSGSEPGAVTGLNLGNAGDINGDGIDDIVIGSFQSDAGATNNGSAFVVFGKAGGFAADIDLDALDGGDGFRINGSGDGTLAGRSVSAAGDINGDGIGDLLIGASGPGTEPGAAYLILGKRSGFAATLDLAAFTDADGLRILGEAAGDRLGFAVSAAGDVNGDGFDDLAIGAPEADPNGQASGSLYILFGGAGQQIGTAGPDVLIGTAGDDAIFGKGGNDRLTGKGGNDLLVGGGGRDVLNGGAGNDVLKGGGGADRALFSAAGGATVDLAVSARQDTGQGRDKLSGIENLTGGGGNDRFDGNGGANALAGKGGNDRLTGKGGQDTLTGGAGRDVLNGGGGDDVLKGGGGRDVLTGGTGDDVLKGGGGGDRAVFSAAGGVTVDLAITARQDTGEGRDKLSGIEDVTSGGGNDRLDGSGAANVLISGGGNDLLSGRAGADTLKAGGGADVLAGGAGNDTMWGGAGADTFDFGPASGADVIRDFEDGLDLIDLVDAGDCSFSRLRIEDRGADAFIGHSGGSILLKNFDHGLLDAGDFLLADGGRSCSEV